MKKSYIIGLIILIMLLAGIALFFLTSNSDDKQQQESQNTSKNPNSESAAVFNPQPTTGASFIATLDGMTSDGEQYSAVIRNDVKGNSHYEGSFGEEKINMYLINGKYVICSENACIESPMMANLPVSADQYQYNEADYNEFKELATYSGREDCNSGVCDVWLIKDGDASGKLFINSQGRVDRTEWSSPDGKFNMDYDYQDVIIEEPENVITTPIS